MMIRMFGAACAVLLIFAAVAAVSPQVVAAPPAPPPETPTAKQLLEAETDMLGLQVRLTRINIALTSAEIEELQNQETMQDIADETGLDADGDGAMTLEVL